MATTRRESPARSGDSLLPRVTHLEGAVESLEKGQEILRDELRAGMHTVFSKLDALTSTVTAVESRRPASVISVLDVINKVAVLAVICAGAIIYMAGNQNAAQLSRHDMALEFYKFRIEQLEKERERDEKAVSNGDSPGRVRTDRRDNRESAPSF